MLAAGIALLAMAAQRPPATTLKAGDLAPDFDLKQMGSDARWKLSSAQGQKPVVLIFGSYT